MAEILDPNNISAFVSAILSLVELGGRLRSMGSKILRGYSSEGMYEVSNYESVLEILDKTGRKAKFRKRMDVRYLQDNIIAFPDFGWADGKGPVNYRVSPGIPVDRYKSGHRTYVVVSLRENKNKGDIDEFNIEWEIKNGFLKKDGYWQTDVSHKFGQLSISLILPKERPPYNVFVEEANRKRQHQVSKNNIQRLPDGKWHISWSLLNPHMYEQYILRWVW